MITTTQAFLNSKWSKKKDIYELISEVCDELQFALIEYSYKKLDNGKTKILYIVKPKLFNSAIGLPIEYILSQKELTTIENYPQTGLKIIKALTRDTLKASFDPDYTFTTIFKNESDDYMIQNGYKLAINLFLLDNYIKNL